MTYCSVFFFPSSKLKINIDYLLLIVLLCSEIRAKFKESGCCHFGLVMSFAARFRTSYDLIMELQYQLPMVTLNNEQGFSVSCGGFLYIKHIKTELLFPQFVGVFVIYIYVLYLYPCSLQTTLCSPLCHV